MASIDAGFDFADRASRIRMLPAAKETRGEQVAGMVTACMRSPVTG